MNLRSHDFVPTHASAGLAMSMISNRVSWFYNLMGPSMTIDTACSSSMIALDMACQGLYTNETDAVEYLKPCVLRLLTFTRPSLLE